MPPNAQPSLVTLVPPLGGHSKWKAQLCCTARSAATSMSLTGTDFLSQKDKAFSKVALAQVAMTPLPQDMGDSRVTLVGT